MILNPLSMPQHFTCIIHNVKQITFNIQAPFSTQNRENMPVGTPKPPTPPCRQNILARLPRPTESKPYKKPADIEHKRRLRRNRSTRAQLPAPKCALSVFCGARKTGESHGELLGGDLGRRGRRHGGCVGTGAGVQCVGLHGRVPRTLPGAKTSQWKVDTELGMAFFYFVSRRAPAQTERTGPLPSTIAGGLGL
jgi:hypothetical protein